MNAPLGDAPHSLTGLQVVDTDGVKVGKVQQVYRDDATNDPEWITVRTGLFGMKETFIPLAGATRTGDELHVPHDKHTIKAAPRIDVDGHLDPSEETELYRHYGMPRPGVSGPEDPEEAAGETPGAGTEASGPGPARGGGAGTASGAGAAGVKDAEPPARPREEGGSPGRAGGERNKLVDGPLAGSGAGTRAGPRPSGRDDEDALRGREQKPETDHGTDPGEGSGPDRLR
ncbi:PRC-barrel domain-containing protein [Streptomyces sp. NBC_01456]|uniref:PRC-barrel domain-containing protein n=1 Tax=unclassified Streptomyces TaxID=2593676 RepID=UPI002E30AFD2|nr:MULTISPECIES: PRC-barrel domain-containing protein [unclassified Streptomyces]